MDRCFFLNEKVEVGGAPEVESEAFDGAVGFVADEEVEEEIVVAGVEVIEGDDCSLVEVGRFQRGCYSV